MKTHLSNRGFTFIETIIYVGLILAVVIMVFELASAGSRTLSLVKEEQAITLDATVILNQLTAQARVVKLPTDIQTMFSLTDGILKFNDGSGERGLTSLENEVISFNITPLSSSHSSAISVDLAIRSRAHPLVSYGYLTTLVLRESYSAHEN